MSRQKSNREEHLKLMNVYARERMDRAVVCDVVGDGESG